MTLILPTAFFANCSPFQEHNFNKLADKQITFIICSEWQQITVKGKLL